MNVGVKNIIVIKNKKNFIYFLNCGRIVNGKYGGTL